MRCICQYFILSISKLADNIGELLCSTDFLKKKMAMAAQTISTSSATVTPTAMPTTLLLPSSSNIITNNIHIPQMLSLFICIKVNK